MPKGGHVPLRSCAGCGKKRPKKELVRIVRTLQGSVEVDVTGKAAGRGMYLCPTEKCWKGGLRKGRLDHALRTTLAQPDREALLAYWERRLEPAKVGDLR